MRHPKMGSFGCENLWDGFGDDMLRKFIVLNEIYNISRMISFEISYRFSRYDTRKTQNFTSKFSQKEPIFE